MAARTRRAPQSAEELVRRYAAGERSFSGAKLAGAKFYKTKLSNVDLREADLRGASLVRVNLRQADLSGANLADCDLSEAKMKGATLCGANCRHAGFDSAKLQGSNFRSAGLPDASFLGADLTRATLDGCYWGGATFEMADLTEASVRDVDMFKARLERATLSRADLSGAHLLMADITEADTTGANFRGATLDLTRLLAIDLSPLCAAASSLVHSGHSFVDHESVRRSIGALGLREFLSQTGMDALVAEDAIESAISRTANMMHSSYIVYGGPDETFARKLYEALQNARIRCFFFPEHAVPGEKLHRTMRKGIVEHDRVILICSRNSLDREGVLFEIEEALTREAKMQGETLLIPIRLDRYVLDEWKPKQKDLAEAVRSRVVADFEGADTDEDKFQAGLRKLVAALRK